MPGIPVVFDPYTLVVGFVLATLFWWLVSKARPLLKETRKNLRTLNENTQQRRSNTIEQNFRRTAFRKAQAMHLAAVLFPLDDILVEPRLLAPPPPIEPGAPPVPEDVITQTVPYLPGWPELASTYRTDSLTVPQALLGGCNLVIIGQPGMGKTVCLAHLASLAANQDAQLGSLLEAIPFLLHVSDLKLPVKDQKEVLKPVIDAVSDDIALLELPRLPTFTYNAFKEGRALLLLDGFDELTSEGQQQVSEWLKLMLQAYPKVRIVTTGAPEYLDGLIGLGFIPLSVITWSEAGCAQFIQTWGDRWLKAERLDELFRSTSDEVDPLLLYTWLTSDYGFLTPLEMTLKVWGAYAGDNLGPHTLESIASHIRRIAPTGTPIAALETLAMQVVLSAEPIFDPRNARQWVRAFESSEDVQDPEEENPSAEDQPAGESEPKTERKTQRILPKATTGLLGRMAASGLLVTNAANRMRFLHPVFFGYLAGRGLSTYHGYDAILNQPDWSGKYLAMKYLAAHGDPSSIVQKLMEWSRLPMHRPLLAAARWLRDARHDASWCGRLYAALAALLQTDDIPLSLRAQALAAFVVSNDSGSAALFRKLASTFSFELVQLAALGCGAVKDMKAIPILEKMLEAPSISTRRAACIALVSIGSNEALEIVAHVLLNADDDLRRAAAEALANHPGEGHAMLKDGVTLKDILLRRAVMYGLARVDEPWAIELLQQAQVQDDQWVVRNAAAESLESRSNMVQRAPRKLKPPSQSPWLIEYAGKQGLGISPGRPATDLLLQALKDEDPDIRLASLPYLKQTPTDGVIGQLYNAMYKDDPELREAAYHVLWEIGASGIKLAHPSQYGFS